MRRAVWGASCQSDTQTVLDAAKEPPAPFKQKGRWAPTQCVCRREETDSLLPPWFCRRFVQPWEARCQSAEPIAVNSVMWQTDRQTDKHWQVNKEISNLFQYCGLISYNAELLCSPQLCEVWSSHSGVVEDSGLLGCYTVLLGKYYLTFRTMLLPSSSGSIGRSIETSVSTQIHGLTSQKKNI